jgi:hypothetical protein
MGHHGRVLAAVCAVLVAGCASNDVLRERMVLQVTALTGDTDEARALYRDRVVGALGGAMTDNGHASGADYHRALRRWSCPQGPSAEDPRDERAIDICSVAPRLDSASRIAALNSLRADLTALADQNCERYMSQIGANRRTYRTLLTASGTIVGAAGALASPAESAAILSGASGLFSGLRGNLDEELFANQALPVMISAMDAERARRRTLMRQDLTASPTRMPTASEIIGAVSVYNEECTLSRALTYATAQARQAAVEAENREDKPATAPPSNAAGAPNAAANAQAAAPGQAAQR